MLHWTTGAPTEPGYYWLDLNDDDGPKVVHIYRAEWPRASMVVFWPGNECDDDLDSLPTTYRWAGPIALPEEPAA